MGEFAEPIVSTRRRHDHALRQLTPATYEGDPHEDRGLHHGREAGKTHSKRRIAQKKHEAADLKL